MKVTMSITVGEKTITLTYEEFKELKEKLDDMFTIKSEIGSLPWLLEQGPLNPYNPDPCPLDNGITYTTEEGVK